MTTRDPDFAPTVDSDIVRQPTAVKPQRLLSIDILRGLTIAFMILVNNQTGPAPFHELSHADWNGFTATDLVFPTFLMLVGLSTVLSTAARLARGATRKELFLHTLRRAFLLILFGFVVNNFPYFHMATARYYGVLPRIGICYFVVATLYLLSPTWKDKVAIVIACLVGYWALMRFVPIPGFGVPTHDFPINDRDINLAAWLDRQIFSAPHLYEHTRDPEGLLSTIPSIATALFGVLAGLWLRTTKSTARKATMPGHHRSRLPRSRARVGSILSHQQKTLDQLLHSLRRWMEPSADGRHPSMSSTSCASVAPAATPTLPSPPRIRCSIVRCWSSAPTPSSRT